MLKISVCVGGMNLKNMRKPQGQKVTWNWAQNHQIYAANFIQSYRKSRSPYRTV